MDFLKKLASPFVEFDDTAAANPGTATVPVTAGGNVPTMRQTSASAPAAIAASAAGIDPAMLAALDKTLLNRKTAYTALLEAANKLTAKVPDEATRLSLAYTMVSTPGRSVKDMIDSIDVHLSDLEGEKMRFKSQSDKEVAQRCVANRTQADSIEAQVGSAQDRINSMQAEINKLNDQINAGHVEAARLRQSADSAEGEIRIVQQRFEAAVDYAKANLASKKTDLQQITS